MAIKIGRNELCWCGSGRKFKKCHLIREFEPPLPIGFIRDKLVRHFRIQECLHPDASESTCGKIANAHTIQRKGALAKIVDSSNHVLTFRYMIGQPESTSEPFRIGWRRASTFPGFCARHDKELFSPVEDFPFVGNAEQCVLIAYRALCHEYYLKKVALSSNRGMTDLVDRGLSPERQIKVQADLLAYAQGVASAIEDFGEFKGRVETIIKSRSYSDWGRLIIPFTGDLCIAFTGVSTPSYDLHGHQIQNLENQESLMAPVFSGLVSTEDGGAVVFVWPPEWASQKFVDSIISRNILDVPSVIAHFAFAHLENTFFSEAWWNTLNESTRNRVSSLVKVFFPEDEKDFLTSTKLVNWDIKEIIMQRPKEEKGEEYDQNLP